MNVAVLCCCRWILSKSALKIPGSRAHHAKTSVFQIGANLFRELPYLPYSTYSTLHTLLLSPLFYSVLLQSKRLFHS